MKASLLPLLLFLLPLTAISQWHAAFPPKSCGSDSSFYDVFIAPGGAAFAVGEDGAAFRGSPPDYTFVPMPVNTNADLYKIHFPSHDTGYIAADHGLLLRTTDSGGSWASLTIPGMADKALYAMHWFSTQIGVLAAGTSEVAHGQAGLPNGVLLYTTNGGTLWQKGFSDPFTFFWAISDVKAAGTDSTLYACGYNISTAGRMYRSTNYGKTWTTDSLMTPFLPYDMAFNLFMAGTRGIAVGGTPLSFSAPPRIALYRESTGWEVLPDTFSVGGFAWSVVAAEHVSPVTDLPIYYVGLNSGMLLQSSDTGATWRPATETPQPLSPCAIYDLAHAVVTDTAGAKFSLTVAAGSGRTLYFRRERIPASARQPNAALPYSPVITACYPQPAERNRVSNIELEISTRPSSPVAVTLYDMLGRKIISLNGSFDHGLSRRFSVPVHGLMPGMYSIIVRTAEGSASRTIAVR